MESNSILLNWDTPMETNGNIIGYEVDYILNDEMIAVNTSDLNTNYTIQDLAPGSHVNNVSVSAYTGAGQGERSSPPTDTCMLTECVYCEK